MTSKHHARSAGFLFTLLAALGVGGCGERETSSPAAQVAQAPTPEEKLATLTKKAEAGDAVAQYNLGEMYYEGEGVPKDAAKALEWYQKAAAQGLAKAQYNLGEMYYEGEGVPRDAAKAVGWLQKAAAQGNANAQYSLGMFYYTGEGVPKDAAKAVEWLQMAAAQGDVYAQHNLGVMYYEGEGVPNDVAKAVEWYQKAAAQGHAKAQHNLGEMYYKGEGVPKDAAKALEWYQKAAAQGHAEAQSKLGALYIVGEGVSKDLVLAYAWINLAAVTGPKNVPALRATIEPLLPAKDLAEAQRLSSGWKKGQVLAREAGVAPSTGVAPGALSKKGNGTLFVVSKAGHAVTNQHVINGCQELRIGGREGTAKLVTQDHANDLALVQITSEVKDAATIASEPGKVRQGEDIVVFGFPLNAVLSSGGNLTPGVVSALTGLGNNTNQIQITAPIQPGSSGSPVLNKKGDVIGVVAMKLSDSKMANATGQIGQNVNFAVSGQMLKTFLDTHQVEYRSSSMFSFGSKGTADLADEARKWTLLVECWK